MIIDIHAHVYLRPLGEFFLSAEEQIEIMDRKGIDRAVILPLSNPEAPGDSQSMGEILTICDRFPGRFLPFCNVDPRLAKSAERVRAEDFLPSLERWKAAGFLGLGEIVACLRFDEPPLLPLMEACSLVGFPVTVHITHVGSEAYGVLDRPGLPHLESLMRRLPALKVLGHSPGFWSEISPVAAGDRLGYPTGPVAPGGRVPQLLRTLPGLYGDLSANSGLGALTRDPGHAWRFLEEFQDRLFLGLDTVSRAGDMGHLEWLRSGLDQGNIRRAVFDKITGGNAARLLGI